jgi:hypothetical protein
LVEENGNENRDLVICINVSGLYFY